MASKTKTVLMLTWPMGDILPRMLAGTLRVADARRWDVYPVARMRASDGSLRFERSPGGGTLEELVALLRPDGVIVANDAVEKAELLSAVRSAGLGRHLPVVYLGESAFADGTVRAHGDSRAFAEQALRELLRFGFDDFAYVPELYDRAWSRARGEAFARLVALAGKRFHLAAPAPPSGGGAPVLAEILEPRLAELPVPCGIFAANDITGEAVLRVCSRLGREVPRQVAVVGVDDNANICDHTHPTLSSIRRDLEGEGLAAAELLADWMAHPGRPPSRSRAVPAISLVRRDSSRLAWQRDRRVARAEEWIRLHACDEGVGPRDVVRAMGVSRTTADRLFRAVSDRTILGQIQSARIERAKERLRAGASADIVAVECGFASTLDFRRVFRRLVGMPVVAWTKKV